HGAHTVELTGDGGGAPLDSPQQLVLLPGEFVPPSGPAQVVLAVGTTMARVVAQFLSQPGQFVVAARRRLSGGVGLYGLGAQGIAQARRQIAALLGIADVEVLADADPPPAAGAIGQ